MRQLTAGLLLVLLTLAGAEWHEKFRSSECYKHGLDDLEDRMPINLGNFIALVEKYENQHNFIYPDTLAEALLLRYKLDGITYQSTSNNVPWATNELVEVEKQDIITKALVPSETVPADTYEPREECSLHFMLSHSTDTYPHPGLDYVWQNSRRRRSEAIFPEQSAAQSRYSLPDNIQPANHPIENGVIWTPYGPVALGTLLSGIMASDKTGESSISQILGETQTNFMPVEMKNKRLNPLYISALAGDIGQSAVIGAMATTTGNEIYLGPNGRFCNLTAAPKLFTLANNYNGITSYLSRAEIFGGIDGLLIATLLQSSSSSQMKLSQILRMYYSEHGLPNNQDQRACNRMMAYKELDADKIKEQALNFMYAYSDKFPEVKRMITEYQDHFSGIESSFKSALNNVWSSFTSFVGSYDYTDYDRCPIYSKKDVKCENKVDLIMVYGHEGGIYEMDKQRQYISLLGTMLSVSVDRSRLGVLDGKSAQWKFPLTNFSNVADWGSNYTVDDIGSYGSGSDMMAVLKELTAYYTNFYTKLHSDGKNASAHSQVVLWNVPGSIPDPDTFLDLLSQFRQRFPDVYFLLVGKSKNSFIDMLVDPSTDFFTNNVQEIEVFAATLAKRICKIPSVFVYPACDTYNSNFSNYQEATHVYTGYVSPNFTTYIKIAPQNFRFSGSLKLKVSNADVSVCSSRESMTVDTTASDYACVTGGTDMEWTELCGRYLVDCAPIFLSVTGQTALGTYCQDQECEYPNQIKFEIHHEGMTCGAWYATSSLLLMAFVCIVHLLCT
ncbi:uncharacterized protein LOC121877623 isoform X3 [Homarus americanus]|uniref:uncharacterized protein LOC121877623 isoform X3 n=1 Tax=Homarus americanus TaxID=6706 RepID=UPI001C477061|nr:uncharacterized protein LOC121877623 isoform X3 [Homarus americanus]XP_042239409.1 uncharacterized protein LOC121877623 isoform X3 [Homarus americanus]